MTSYRVAAVVLALAVWTTSAHAQGTQDPNEVRPIDAAGTLFIDEMTFMEVRDALREGKTTAIVGTGGVEQNGPYTATGKHNFVMRVTGRSHCPQTRECAGRADRAVRPRGAARAAHRAHAVCRHDQRHRRDLPRAVARHLHEPEGARVYRHRADRRQRWQPERHEGRGRGVECEVECRQDARVFRAGVLHAGHVELRLPEVARHPSAARRAVGLAGRDARRLPLRGARGRRRPAHIRAEQRIKAGKFSINGVDLESVASVVANGRKLAAYRADITVAAIRTAIAAARRPLSRSAILPRCRRHSVRSSSPSTVPPGPAKGRLPERSRRRLEYRHLDTGAMYRAVAWKALHDGCRWATRRGRGACRARGTRGRIGEGHHRPARCDGRHSHAGDRSRVRRGGPTTTGAHGAGGAAANGRGAAVAL